MELNALTLGSMLMVFFAGGLVGWLLRQPKTITVSPPDLERERTLAEAKHQAPIDAGVKEAWHVSKDTADRMRAEARDPTPGGVEDAG